MKFTLLQFKERYPNDNACLDEIFKQKYGYDPCPKCNAVNSYTRITTVGKKNKAQRKVYQCTLCRHQISPLAGTIFEKTRTPLTFWFTAIFLFTTTRNGLSAKEIERLLGVTYKCAFRMGHLIRSLMNQSEQPMFTGVTAIDECFIGGALSNKHHAERLQARINHTITENKIKLFGMVEGSKRAYVKVIDKSTTKEIMPIIQSKIQEGTTIVSDGAFPFGTLKYQGYTHVKVKHAADQWVKGDFHTNSIEGFWANLRRMIDGTHVKVTKKYLQNYVDECCFRYEHRDSQEGMFNALVNRIC